MAEPSAVTMAFPLIAADASVSEAVDLAAKSSANAVVSQEGREFRLHLVDELSAIAVASPSQSLQAAPGHPLEVLRTTEAFRLAPDLLSLDHRRVRQIYPDFDTKPLVTEILDDVGGTRMVAAMVSEPLLKALQGAWQCPNCATLYSHGGACKKDEIALLKVSSGVWECPRDFALFPRGGKCKTHGLPLRKIR